METMLKDIYFRPLRRVKKTRKITVASYMQWRKVKVMDNYAKYENENFNLLIDEEYKSLPKKEFVYNHKGENLFWRHYNPEEIKMISGYELEDGERVYPEMWKTDYDMYCADGLDCDGVPALSHYTSNDIVNSGTDVTEFVPLTVEIVNYWFGWFLYKLNHANFKTAN